jgi:aminopeptidase N
MKMASITFLLLFSCAAIAQKVAVDFTHVEATIQPYPNDGEIKGTVDYTFILNQNNDSIFIDAQKMDIANFSLDGKAYPYVNTGKKIGFKAPKILGKHKLFLSYIVKPDQALYFVGYDDGISGNEQIWTQGQGKYTSNWLPSFDDMTEKVEFDISIVYDEKFTVIANGILKDSKIANGLKKWNFDMQKPMSSYLLAIAIGQYDKQQLISQSGIPIENYYYPSDSLHVEPTYRYTKDIFDFLETEIGVPYPWQNYKQVPVHDFLYAGMENTSATLFSDAYIIDASAFVDRNYININAHELAHQWFGNLVTEKSGEHHWLQEGFATYYAYLAEKKVFGDDHFYWKLFESAKVLKEVSDRGEGQSLLDPKASSLTFYEKGAWALFILQEKVGETDFKNGIKNCN